MYNKHYIRLSGTDITHAFSDAFEQPQAGDICVNEQGERHFVIQLRTFDGLYRLKWDGKQIVEKSHDEIYTPYVLSAIADAEARRKLAEIDLASIRAIREYIASKNDCPEILKQHEAAAVEERKKAK